MARPRRCTKREPVCWNVLQEARDVLKNVRIILPLSVRSVVENTVSLQKCMNQKGNVRITQLEARFRKHYCNRKAKFTT